MDFLATASIGLVKELEQAMARKWKSRPDQKDTDLFRQCLFDMEPELRMLEGVVAALHAVSLTPEAVEPIALMPLAHLSEETLQKILAIWRQALLITRSQPTGAWQR